MIGKGLPFLDISVTCFGPSRLGPQGDKIPFVGKGLSKAKRVEKRLGLSDKVIGREYHHHSVLIFLLQVDRRQTDCGGGVSSDRLGDKAGPSGGRFELEFDLLRLGRVGDDVDLAERDEAGNPGQGRLDKSLIAENFQELLRIFLTTQRPKTGSTSPCQNHAIHECYLQGEPK